MAIMDTAAGPVIDLVSLIEQRGVSRLRYTASTDEGEYTGACPFCGTGKDRFHVWPHAAKPHYWCRICQAKGDAIQFLRDYENLSFREACDELGLDLSDYEYQGTPAPASNDQPPPKKWIELMSYIVETGNKHLLAGSTSAARQYWQYLSERGIMLETVEKKRIAFTALPASGRWLEVPFADVGITEDMVPAQQWAKGCIRIPDGLIFPYYVNSDLWKLGVKRPFVQDGTMQRGQILGSKECLLNEDMIRPGMPVIMTEAYLDAVSIEQVAGDLIVSVSTDGTSNGRSARCQMRLKYADYGLQTFDNDDAGHEAAAWWCSTLKNYVRWPALYGKDVNEMLVAGHDLRAWIQDGMGHVSKFAHEPLVSLVIESLPMQQQEPTSLSIELIDESLYVCAICSTEVERYTTKGTACCQKHYAAQQQIEQLLDGYQSEQGVLSAEELQRRYSSEIQKVLGKCELEIYPGGMSINEIIKLRWKELQQQAAAKHAAMHQRSAWNARAKRGDVAD